MKSIDEDGSDTEAEKHSEQEDDFGDHDSDPRFRDHFRESFREDLGSDSFVEVDRGAGLSFGWVGTDSTYAVLLPGYRGDGQSKKTGMFGKSERELGVLVSPRIVFKVISTSGEAVGVSVDVAALDVLNNSSTSSSSSSSAASNQSTSILPQELFGGLLLCVSTPLRSTLTNKDPKGDVGGQRSVRTRS